MLDPALVGLGGMGGALARYLVGRTFADGPFPLPTLLVNLLGSFLFGLVLGFGAGDRVVLLVGIGFCGAFTTYATFAVDTVRLWDENPFRALWYAVGTLVGCLLAAGLAWAVGLAV